MDADGNGFVDDIAGWDFFDDDNNAWDASSYSSASNHGTGRASDAAEQGDDASGEIGVCPGCSILPVRVWDTFVVSGDQYGLGAAFAADSGAAVIEVALGALSNSEFSQAATRYAYDKGTTLAVVSSDLNTASHNYPTNYNEPIFVNGIVADTYGGDNEFALPGGGGNRSASRRPSAPSSATPTSPSTARTRTSAPSATPAPSPPARPAGRSGCSSRPAGTGPRRSAARSPRPRSSRS